MNSIDIRTEKANAIFRYRSIQRLTTLFRFMEICVFIVVISTFSVQFPFSVTIPTDQFKEISFTGFSPKFVFVVGNVIVLTLLFKSRFADHDQIGGIDVYDEYVKRCENNIQSEKIMAVECKDGQSRRELTRSVIEGKVLNSSPSPENCRSRSEKMMAVECGKKIRGSVTEGRIVRSVPEICRSRSEKVVVVGCNDGESGRKLRRSVTEGRMVKDGGDGLVVEGGGVDGLSSEAFRRTVEAFIERQQRCLRDEELAPVTYEQPYPV